jgi:hypothetical protein
MAFVRTKTSYHKSYRKDNGGPWFGNGDKVVEHMASKKLPGTSGNYVFHSRALPIVDVQPYEDLPLIVHCATGNHPIVPTNWGFLDPVPDIPRALPLNREKFYSTGDFNILVFLNEFKETLDVFRLSFWKSINYGSFTWGVMPFVGEIQGLMESLAKFKVLTESEYRMPYEDSLSIDIDYYAPDRRYRCQGTLTYHVSGFLDFSGIDHILQIYDLLGFHPDISTVWDSLPLSFLADAFLPIGDFLDNFVDEGWVTSALFTGWASQDFYGGYSQTGGGWGLKTLMPVSVYERNYVRGALGEVYHPRILLQSELPSIRDMFNFAYISRCYTDREFVLSKLKPKQRRVFKLLVTTALESFGSVAVIDDILNAFESQT